MKAKLKLLKRIQTARMRMRDAAAAEAALAEGERMEKDALRGQIQDMRKEIMSDAAKRFNAAASIADIERVAIEMTDADHCLKQAETALDTAAGLSRTASLELRGRERELRLSEKLVKRETTNLRKSEAKEEQAMVDDMTASQKRGEE